MKAQKKKLSPRKVFWQCGACSHAMFHLLNLEFDNEAPDEEKASDILAGGIALKGHQCGMLWGATLATGVEANRKFDNKDKAIAVAMNSSIELADSFRKRAKSLDCRDIAKVDWNNKFQFIIYMIKTFSRGLIFSHCFNLFSKWGPEAIQTAKQGINKHDNDQTCLSCSTEVLKKMGATADESVFVAGFAGGIGLSGNACGALGAALWYKMLDWIRKNPTETPSMFKNKEVEKIFEAFNKQTNSETLCKNICGKTFNTIEEHSDFVKNGGCKDLLEALSNI